MRRDEKMLCEERKIGRLTLDPDPATNSAADADAESVSSGFAGVRMDALNVEEVVFSASAFSCSDAALDFDFDDLEDLVGRETKRPTT